MERSVIWGCHLEEQMAVLKELPRFQPSVQGSFQGGWNDVSLIYLCM